MKTFLLLTFLMATTTARAVPVIDTARGSSTVLVSTVLPDDKDPNLFYFFPTHYQLAMDPVSKKYLFSYVESGWPFPSGYVSSIFEAVTSPVLDTKVQEVKTANPKALFSPIPILDANFEVAKALNPLVSAIECQKKGNEIGSQIECQWSIDFGDRKTFRKVARGGTLVQAINYNYSFSAIQGGKPIIVNQTLPAYFTNLGAGDYFFDTSGDPIKN